MLFRSELGDLRWRLHIEATDHRIVSLMVPRALGDDVIDSGDPEVMRELENRLRTTLNAKDSLVVEQ